MRSVLHGVALVGVATAAFGTGSCTDSEPLMADGTAAELPLRPRFPVDGVANLDAFPIVFDGDVAWEGVSGPSAGTTSIRIAKENDDEDLYIAVQWDDDTNDNQLDPATDPRFDGIRVQFDSNGDGVVGPGDDAKTVYTANGGSLYLDRHVMGGPGGGPDSDLLKDGIGDGLGRLGYDASQRRYTAEFLLTFGDDSAAEDGLLSAETPFAISIRDGSNGGRWARPNGPVVAGSETEAWPTLELVSAERLERPGLPDDLTGLIALLSEHEGPRRVYLYRPRSQELVRVPVDETLHIERLSLSHDRNWILLEASYSPEERSTYEIFRVATDGNRLERLTDNDVFDGAPSWSGSDERIVYTSERDTREDGRPLGSIILMTADGVELDDLSADVVDERDPSYLEDGRIVLKTTRASPWPKFRIAAIRESGASFDILTEALGGTDHHPHASGPWIYYERFRGDGFYATDPGVRTKSWDILSVHTLGGQGSTLVADGWANRMPVPDPTGAYVAHLRQSGHSYVELITWTGTYLGRLIPDVTEAVQIDWK